MPPEMPPEDKSIFAEMGLKAFDIKDEPMPRGAWWWWWWLFMFDNPDDPDRPRQLMILWSTKNVKKIDCNDLLIKLDDSQDRSKLDGVVAAWYFDGEEMHHNFLLEQCYLKVSDTELLSDSKIPTSFSVDGAVNSVKIGDDFNFISEVEDINEFTIPVNNSHAYIGSLGYSILRLNRLGLKGEVNGEQIQGSSYFQRVFVTAPAVPWYWGIFHFENGAILSYFNPNVFGITIAKDISFFDGKRMHEIKEVKVVRSGGDIPTFTVLGENEDEKMSFTVSSYSHSSWTFKKRTLGIIPNKLVYNEYPAVISDLRFTNKKTGEEITLEDLGRSVGNAEHTTGLLL
ncbi:MAG: hypothetical protein SVM80_07200 [Halobacteriota archaeon]|nr:hypothetical protein [Halobacteriota archaeon]